MVTAQQIAKIWRVIRYSHLAQSCGNCRHADDVEWSADDHGWCAVLGERLKFPIIRHGICKHHSSFNHGNVKRYV